MQLKKVEIRVDYSFSALVPNRTIVNYENFLRIADFIDCRATTVCCKLFAELMLVGKSSPMYVEKTPLLF